MSENGDVTRVKTVPWWVGPAFAVLAIGAVPWVIFLAVTLPRHATFAHYRAVWVGFDAALVVVLALTAYMAWRGHAYVALSSTAAATMLLVDAWFDVMTTPRGHGLLLSLALAVLVELPLAAICLWIALHAEMVIENRVQILARRVRGVGKRSGRTGGAG
jgi:hypothetical protein